MNFKEYLERAKNERRLEFLSDSELNKILTTPFVKLDKEYRNLLPNPGEVGIDKASEKKVLEWLMKTGGSLDRIIEDRLDTASKEYSEYDDFDEEYEEGDPFYESYFIFKDDNNEPCGFLAYVKGSPSSKKIEEVVLFSFDLSRKDFGKQIWIDFEKNLIEKIKKGYTVSWKCKKENPASMRYNKIIENLNGKRNSCGDYWEYRIENI